MNQDLITRIVNSDAIPDINANSNITGLLGVLMAEKTPGRIADIMLKICQLYINDPDHHYYVNDMLMKNVSIKRKPGTHGGAVFYKSQ